MDHKAVVVAIDVGGRVGLKLNGDIRHGGIELEVWLCTAVLSQDVGCQVVSIIEGQQVILTNMETATDIRNGLINMSCSQCIPKSFIHMYCLGL